MIHEIELKKSLQLNTNESKKKMKNYFSNKIRIVRIFCYVIRIDKCINYMSKYY